MDDDLLDVVLGRLDQVTLGEEAASLLLAACEGDGALTAQLGGEGREEHERSAAQSGTGLAGAYLRSITVSGFRGVGPAAQLELEPGPGLTVIAGRNGSGKSSFADGLEVLLTGNLRRWEELSAAWRDSWRNLHATGTVTLSAELILEGSGRAVAERSWSGAAAFAASNPTVQLQGEKREELGRLGWDEALKTYRPFLSHSELEAFLHGPSHLYDLLSSVLGLEELTAAEKRLSKARKEREDRVKEVNADLPALLSQLGSVDEERAVLCHAALTGRKRDLQRALSVATGAPTAQPDGEISRLRLLSQLTVPTADQVKAAATGLRGAASALTEAAESEAGQAQALAKLLSSALDHYRAHGPGSCPVCGRPGALDGQWQAQTEQEIARQQARAVQAGQAQAGAVASQQLARELLLPPPTVLTGPPVGAVDPGSARLAWLAWAKHPDAAGADGLRRLAGHIEESWVELSRAVATLVAAAESELRIREDRWAPAARETVAWCSRAQEAEAAARVVPSLKAAIRWLKGATDDIRNDRLAPLGERARAIWSMLRQESNVDLGPIRLSGSGPMRKVDVKVTVDGSPGTALGVMSQGEINALALSIFLPRATIAASPFRFLVIDDPVQAMDPAKVDGLAHVLEDVSRSHQVLVFTHDDRLPEAVRRLGITARILEVTRRVNSIVEIRPGLTPVDRQLKDAYDMCADNALPPGVAARVVPGLCRLAVEAAFTEAAYRTQLRGGRQHAQVEAAIEAASSLNKRAALAMFGDPARVSEVVPRLGNWQRAAADTYKALNRGAHTEYQGPLRPLVDDARALTSLIREKLS